MLDSSVLKRSAEKFGTPHYLYDFPAIEQRITELKNTLPDCVELYYAVKANPNKKLLEYLRPLVDGLDISSGGEIEQALIAGYSPEQMSFAGPGKNEQELTLAITNNIGSLSIESRSDMHRISAIAQRIKKRAKVLLRINPDKLIHKFAVKMGGKATQFGVDESEAAVLITEIMKDKNLELNGLHIYSGTQCLDAASLIDNFSYILGLAAQLLTTHHLPLTTLNLGGGFGVPYFDNDQPLNWSEHAPAFTKLLDAFEKKTGLNPRYILELGRYIVGEAGYYITRILNIKRTKDVTYYILDGGMHHHLAASGNLGQVIKKNYKVINISTQNKELRKVHLCGPLCTPLDTLAQNIELPVSQIDDILVFLNSGAYAFTASPLLFLGHETPPEIIYRKNDLEMIRPAFDMTALN